jgi:hypothetical protein
MAKRRKKQDGPDDEKPIGMCTFDEIIDELLRREVDSNFVVIRVFWDDDVEDWECSIIARWEAGQEDAIHTTMLKFIRGDFGGKDE